MDVWILSLEKRTTNAFKVQSGWFLYPKPWNPCFLILWVHSHQARLMAQAATNWVSIRLWERGSGSWITHPWKRSRPGYMELGASWFNRSCPCPWGEHWNKMIFNVPFNTNHPVIFWSTLVYLWLPWIWWVREWWALPACSLLGLQLKGKQPSNMASCDKGLYRSLYSSGVKHSLLGRGFPCDLLGTKPVLPM